MGPHHLKVLIPGGGVDQIPHSHKEQGLEEGMCNKVKEGQQGRASGPASQLLLLAFAVSTEQQRQRGNSQLSYS